jgi:hypothetical protein
MNKSDLSVDQFLELQGVKDHVDLDAEQQIRDYLETTDEASAVQMVVQGFGAWLSTLSFLIFLGVSGVLTDSPGELVLGICFAAAAISLGRFNRNTFLDQLGLAFALCGNTLLLIGVTNSVNADIETAIVAHAVIGSGMYCFYPNVVYRFLAPVVMSILLLTWSIESAAHWWAFDLLIAFHVALIGYLFLHRDYSGFRQPIANAVAVMLPVLLLFVSFQSSSPLGLRFETDRSLYVSSAVLTLALFFLFRRVVNRPTWLNEKSSRLAVGGTVILGIFTTPGVLAAGGLLILGRFTGHRLLASLGHGFLAVFLIVYYYNLNIDLAYKSWVLAGSGVLLLILRRLTRQPTVVCLSS